MSTKPVIVAQAPSRSSEPGRPLSGASGRRLACLCDLDHAAFLARFERVNLLKTYPGSSGGGKGDAFPLGEARASFARLARQLRGRQVVLLGRAVAGAAGIAAPPFAWVEARGTRFAVCPHPSGVNRWWNESKNVRAARRFWRALV